MGRAEGDHAFRTCVWVRGQRGGSFPCDRNTRGSLARRAFPGGIFVGQGVQKLYEGYRQRPSENVLEDGDLHAAELSGCADFRSDWLEQVACGPLDRKSVV